ncbi:D-isomer specific 2-hydroxyacid dehydrogenase [Caballeronia hypogeia]|uniref:D-isomer specific 2-hydroxyacid dehydrogenase n=1 Tax=Caballeronia hypogeia TaxID=1777140 RepID=A0A157ZK80_9BURK|nr:D-glycerate dehydrogenase [Caballeronia hypogeia]SAK45944.1 D-isomer specific 2-hydroxyacid dehydrogenase [Caballeronia hypogeia]
MKHRMIFSRPMQPAVEDRAKLMFDAFVPRHALSVDELVSHAHAHEAQGLLFSGALRLDRALIERLPKSLRVASTTSVGFDHIDVDAAAAANIVVTNAPVVTECTADATMMHMLAACRRAREHLQVMQDGWGRSLGLTELLGHRVSGSVLGIVGMGRIGQAVAQRARAFGMTILYHSRRRLAPELEQGARYFASLDEMLPHAQILSLHLPASPGASPLIGAPQLAMLPRGAIVVNTARGSLIDEDALIAALQSGQIAAAGLDVFHNEPRFDERFLELPQVFLTPHSGSATVQTRNDLGYRALDNIAAVLDGRPAIDPLIPRKVA